MRRVVPAVLASLGLVASAGSQELVWEREGVPNLLQFGGRLAAVGDVDGDGYDDVMHVVTRFVPSPRGGRYEDTELWTLSGLDGSTLRIRPAISHTAAYREVAAAGDVDGDGTPDYVATVIDQASGIQIPVEVRSGVDDALVWSVQGPSANGYGSAVLGNLDLDGDAKPDLLVTAPLETSYGMVYTYRNDGALLYKLPGTPQLLFKFRGGHCLGRIGDFDGDGAEDFVLGAIDGTVGLGAAVVVSGPTGRILAKGLGPNPWENVGDSVDGCGDLDGDRVLDFAASSSGATSLGVALAYSGRTGQPLFTWWGTQGGRHFGSALRSGGVDFDQDGLPDVVVGSNLEPVAGTGGGSVFVYSSRNGGEIHRVDNTEFNATRIGNWLDVVPASPASPFPLMVLPEPNHSGYTAQWGGFEYLGRIRMFRGTPAGAQVFGQPCQGTLGSTPRIGMRDLAAQGVRLHLSDASPGTPALLLLGVTRWTPPVPLELLGFPGCELYTSAELFLFRTTGTTGIAAGYTFSDLPVPLAAPGTVTLHGQWVSVGSGAAFPGALSAAMLWQH